MAKKSLGQHFLINEAVIAQILYYFDIEQTDHIIEIGPGKGALTTFLAGQSKRLDLIELDKALIPTLQKDFLLPREKLVANSTQRIFLHHADVLTFDFDLIIQNGKKIRLIGNLPYNISTPLLFYLIRFKAVIQDCLFMLQKEVVDRITACPNTKNYGRLSVMMQYHFKLFPLFEIPPQAFYPEPKVHSAILKLLPYTFNPKQAPKDYALFKKLIQDAFAHKRKTLKNNLQNYFRAEDWKTIHRNFKHLHCNLRAENLTLNDFITLSNFKGT